MDPAEPSRDGCYDSQSSLPSARNAAGGAERTSSMRDAVMPLRMQVLWRRMGQDT